MTRITLSGSCSSRRRRSAGSSSSGASAESVESGESGESRGSAEGGRSPAAASAVTASMASRHASSLFRPWRRETNFCHALLANDICSVYYESGSKVQNFGSVSIFYDDIVEFETIKENEIKNNKIAI